VADAGKALIAEAEVKASEPLDNLDQEVLFQVSGGKRLPIELQNTLNVRSKDLALHIYKLYKQGLLIYELKSGGADLQLTEGGFIKAKATNPTKQAAVPQPQIQSAGTTQASTQAPQAQPTPEQQPVSSPKSSITLYLSALIVLVILVILYLIFIRGAI
jgi:hypothetical protein